LNLETRAAELHFQPQSANCCCGCGNSTVPAAHRRRSALTRPIYRLRRRPMCPQTHEAHRMSTQGAHSVGLVHVMSLSRARCYCNRRLPRPNPLQSLSRAPPNARDPRNEHPRCSLCGPRVPAATTTAPPGLTRLIVPAAATALSGSTHPTIPAAVPCILKCTRPTE
jgi:hypothetical protein